MMNTGEDVRWIQKLTKLPLIIKGIQCVEVLFHVSVISRYGRLIV